MENSINVCLLTDDNYVVPCAVTVCSLLENNKDVKELNIFILDDNISKENKTKMNVLVGKYHRKVSFIDVSEISSQIEKMGLPKVGNGYTSYTRLFIQNLLPDYIERVLVIDCDLLVNGSIEELFNTDMKDCIIGAVIDGMNSIYNKTIGFTMSDLYFNTGVMLVNLVNYRKKDYITKFINVGKILTKPMLPDQDFINVVFKGTIYTLKLQYNYIAPNRMISPGNIYMYMDKEPNQYYSMEEMKEAERNPVIIHFTSSVYERPWFINSIDPLCNKWDEFLKMTPWFNYKKKKLSISFGKKLHRLAYNVLPNGLYASIYKHRNINRVERFLRDNA